MRRRKALEALIALAAAWTACAEEILPSAPAEVVKPAAQSPPMVEGSEIVMRPGVSVVAPIAFGHLNRIVTPFDNPQVRTVSKAQIQVHDQVVYVATEEESPITLFITPNGRESPSLPLILAPRKIPPREIRLKLPEEEEKALRLQEIRSADPAQALGKDAPHIANVKSIMRDLAKGRVPAGFAMRDPSPADAVRCFQSGVRIEVGQVMEGPGLVLRVAVLQNTSGSEFELDETRCAASGETVAVAAWPKVRLEPREKTELYVLSRLIETPPESVRPSLLGGS